MLTRRCNLSCDYCPIEKDNRTMPPETAFRAVDMFRAGASRVRLLRFFGGEPLLEFDLISRVFERVKATWGDQSPKFDLTTNGTIRRPEVFRFFQAHTDIEPILSVDDQKQMNVRNIESFSALRNLTVNLTVAPSQAGMLSRNLRLMCEAGARKFNILPVLYVHWSRERIRIFARELDAIRRFSEKGDVLFKNASVKSSVPLFPDGVFVDCNGTVYSSSLVLSRHLSHLQSQFEIGHVNRWNGNPPALTDMAPGGLWNAIRSNVAPKALSSTRTVDRVLTRFVTQVRAAAKPLHLILLLTNRCTLRCRYCWLKKGDEEIGHPVLEELAEQIALSGSKEVHIDFNGGEPSLAFEKLVFLVEKLKSSGRDKQYRFSLSTNGTRITEDMVVFLRQHGFSVVVSCDGFFSDHVFNRKSCRGKREDYDLYKKTLRSILMCRKAGVFTKVNLVVAPETVNRLSFNYSFLTRLKPHFINLSPVVGKPWNEGDIRRLRLQLTRIREAAASAKGMDIHRMAVQDKIDDTLYVLNRKDKFPGARGFVVHWDGTLYSDECPNEKAKRLLYVGKLQDLPVLDGAHPAARNLFDPTVMERVLGRDAVPGLAAAYDLILGHYSALRQDSP